MPYGGERVSRAGHTRRQFLRALGAGVAGLGAGIGAAARPVPASASASASASGASARLLDADVLELSLTELGRAPRPYTTAWPTGTNLTVHVWDDAFAEAQARLAAAGGGRLVIPGAAEPYYLQAHQVFDLPSVTVQLAAGAEVLMVGPPDPWLGAPIGFYGGFSAPDHKHRQREFAAVLGPGKVGFPKEQLAYYDRGNGLGFSYIKTVHVEGVAVPYAPRFALTAQYGCADVSYVKNTIGYTGLTADERALPGHAVLNVSGGLIGEDGKPRPGWLGTNVTVADNVIAGGHRSMYLENLGDAVVSGNRIGPMTGMGMTIAVAASATVSDNTFQQVSTEVPGDSNGIHLYDVRGPASVTRNVVRGTTHLHCVQCSGSRASKIVARKNTWTKGRGTVFTGSPFWDSDT